MKQYISEKQFNKLPDKAQKLLSQGGYPKLSVGQLIEFLAKRKRDIHIERFDGGKEHSHWDISTCYDEEWKFGREQKELCDALWEAVKKELETQKKSYIR